MAHIKLANPRRALYSQVLLSNFMYSYLAKVQQMHPQMQLPTSATQKKQQEEKKKQQQQQSANSNQPEEYSQYQRYQEVCHAQYPEPSSLTLFRSSSNTRHSNKCSNNSNISNKLNLILPMGTTMMIMKTTMKIGIVLLQGAQSTRMDICTEVSSIVSRINRAITIRCSISNMDLNMMTRELTTMMTCGDRVEKLGVC